MGLSAQEMVEVGELVNESVSYAIDSFPSTSLESLVSYVYSLRTQEILTSLFSGHMTGIKRLNQLVFTNRLTEQFILTVTSHFFAKFGDTRNRYPALCENLGEAIGFIKPEKDSLAMVSQDYLADVPSVDDVENLLLDNRWATMLALIILYLMPLNSFQELFNLKREEERKQAALDARQVRLEAQVAPANK